MDISGLDTAHHRAPVAQWLTEHPGQEFNSHLELRIVFCDFRRSNFLSSLMKK